MVKNLFNNILGIDMNKRNSNKEVEEVKKPKKVTKKKVSKPIEKEDDEIKPFPDFLGKGDEEVKEQTETIKEEPKVVQEENSVSTKKEDPASIQEEKKPKKKTSKPKAKKVVDGPKVDDERKH